MTMIDFLLKMAIAVWFQTLRDTQETKGPALNKLLGSHLVEIESLIVS